MDGKDVVFLMQMLVDAMKAQQFDEEGISYIENAKNDFDLWLKDNQ